MITEPLPGVVVVQGGPVSALLTICDPVSCCWCWTVVT